MNEQRTDDKNLGYSHGQHILQDAVRGFAAAGRGMLEGRKLKREARNDREKRTADEAYRQRTLDLADKRAKMQDTFQNRQLTEQTNIQQQLADLEKQVELNKVAEADTERTFKRDMMMKRYELEEQAEKNQARINTLSAIKIADRTHENNIELQDLQAENQRLQTAIDATNTLTRDEKLHEQDIDKIETTGDITTKQIGVKGEQDVRTEQARGESDLAVQQATDAAEMERLQYTTTQKKRAALANTNLTSDEISIATTMIDDYAKDQRYNSMGKIAEGYQAIIAGYIGTHDDIGSGAGDLTMLNSFQRLIDPGVSVREGDVVLLQMVEAMIAKIQTQAKRYTEGTLLSPELRDRLMRVATLIYNSKQAFYKEKVQSVYESRLAKFGLEGKFGMEDLGTTFDADFKTLSDYQALRERYATVAKQDSTDVDMAKKGVRRKDYDKPQITMEDIQATVPGFDLEEFDALLEISEKAAGQQTGGANAINRPDASTAQKPVQLDSAGIAGVIKESMDAGTETYEQAIARVRAKLTEWNIPEDQHDALIQKIEQAYNSLNKQPETPKEE